MSLKCGGTARTTGTARTYASITAQIELQKYAIDEEDRLSVSCPT